MIEKQIAFLALSSFILVFYSAYLFLFPQNYQFQMLHKYSNACQ